MRAVSWSAPVVSSHLCLTRASESWRNSRANSRFSTLIMQLLSSFDLGLYYILRKTITQLYNFKKIYLPAGGWIFDIKCLKDDTNVAVVWQWVDLPFTHSIIRILSRVVRAFNHAMWWCKVTTTWSTWTETRSEGYFINSSIACETITHQSFENYLLKNSPWWLMWMKGSPSVRSCLIKFRWVVYTKNSELLKKIFVVSKKYLSMSIYSYLIWLIRIRNVNECFVPRTVMITRHV